MIRAVILFQCRTNTLRLKWRQGFDGGAMDCPMCGAVEGTVAHFVTECGVLEEMREQFGVIQEEALEVILLFTEKTEEKVERSITLLEKRNGSTNAGTCTSVVQEYRGADKKDEPRRTSSPLLTCSIISLKKHHNMLK